MDFTTAAQLADHLDLSTATVSRDRKRPDCPLPSGPPWSADDVAEYVAWRNRHYSLRASADPMQHIVAACRWTPAQIDASQYEPDADLAVVALHRTIMTSLAVLRVAGGRYGLPTPPKRLTRQKLAELIAATPPKPASCWRKFLQHLTPDDIAAACNGDPA